MEKTYVYNKGKKLSMLYMVVVIIVGILFTIRIYNNLMEDNINQYFEERVDKFKIEGFISTAFNLNPNLEYVCKINNKGTKSEQSQVSLILNSAFPILDYIMKTTNIISHNVMFEIYPYLEEIIPEENHVEVFAQLDENFIMPSNNIPQSSEPIASVVYSVEQLSNFNFLLNNIYTVDHTLEVTMDNFDINYFMHTDMHTELEGDQPKILIYHTHSQESFIDSEKSEKSDTVVGVGDELVRILEEEYGIEAMHLRKEYDIINGVLDRSRAYEEIEVALENIIRENPSLEVLIDIHRDGIPDDLKFVTNIDGKDTAMIMFFNGLSEIKQNGVMTPVAYLPNPYIKDNMAFSMQMHLKANELYPGLTRKIYLKGLRYNLHLKPKSLLIEVGAQTNTVEEAKNAMEPLAKILYEVIK